MLSLKLNQKLIELILSYYSIEEDYIMRLEMNVIMNSRISSKFDKFYLCYNCSIKKNGILSISK